MLAINETNGWRHFSPTRTTRKKVTMKEVERMRKAEIWTKASRKRKAAARMMMTVRSTM
jgi:hypothetical protein